MNVFSAREELTWFFRWGDSAMGLHGGGLDSEGVRVYDDAASHRKHMGLRRIEYRHGVQRRQRVAVALAMVTWPHRRDLTLAYTPFGAARASWQAQRAMMVAGRPLLGLVLRTTALRAALAKRYQTDAALTQEMLLRFVEDEVSGSRVPAGLHAAVDEADRRETEAVEEYVVVRIDGDASQVRLKAAEALNGGESVDIEADLALLRRSVS